MIAKPAILRARLAVAGLALAALAATGCGGSSDSSSSASAGKQVATTKVKVIESSGKSKGFDPISLYQRISPGVVTIVSRGKPSLLGGGNEGGLGSGFVLDKDGYIATNAHVVLTDTGPGAKPADQLLVQFESGDQVPAKVVGTDPNADVALLKVDTRGLTLTPLELGSSGDLVVGEPVAAIGSPFAERSTLTVGIVSALDRAIDSLTNFKIGNAIQTDAAINPGNSGGPLLDSGGKVIGINQQIKSRGGGGEGVGFAVPVDVIRRSLDELRKSGKVNYGFLGVTSQPLYPQLADRLGIDEKRGALVVKVQSGSPADDAGLTAGEKTISFQGQDKVPSNGDVILAVDGKKLTRTEDLSDRISLDQAGDEVELEVVRDGKKRTVKVKLDKRPSTPARP